MEIHTLPLGSFRANCYILHNKDSADCLVIDPGDEAGKLLSFLERNALTVRAVLLTHRHFDHVGAANAVAARFHCPVYLHEADAAMKVVFLFGNAGSTVHYAEGDRLELAGLSVSVLHTPGHSPGSVCLLCENALFTGDTLFALSCGRTDFPGSSPKDMRASLGRLAALEENYNIYPGHGESSTLLEEKNRNPYLNN